MKTLFFILVVLPSIIFAQKTNVSKPIVSFSKYECGYFDAGSMSWDANTNKWFCISQDTAIASKIFKMHQVRSVKKNKLLFMDCLNEVSHDKAIFDESTVILPSKNEDMKWEKHYPEHNIFFIENAQKNNINNPNLSSLLDSLHIKKWIVFGKSDMVQHVVNTLLSKGYEVNLVEDLLFNESNNDQNSSVEVLNKSGVNRIQSKALFHYYKNE